jgi:phenylacetate-CoA ligase
VPDHDAFFEPEIETMTRADLDAFQRGRLLELLPYAYERSALHKENWDAAGIGPGDVSSVADFRDRVPFSSKDAIRSFRDRTGDPYGGLLCIDPADLTSVTSSSGTTGDATFFPDQWEVCSRLQSGYARPLWDIGVRPGDYCLGNSPTFRGENDWAYRLLGAIPLAVNTWMGNWAEVLQVIEQYRPTYGQFLGPIVVELRHLEDRSDLKKLFGCFAGVSFAGEPMGVRTRTKIREDWGVELFMYTSAGDTGTSWECRQHDGYHLWEDMVFVECLRPGGNEPVDDGDVGELVVTALDDTVAPVIRYRTEDLVRVDRSTCGCGRTHARQWPVGRMGDETVVQGKAVLPAEVWAAIERLDETEAALFQIIRPQREVEQLRLRVGYDPDRTGDLSDLDERLRAAVLDAVGVEPTVELLPEAAILARGTAAKVPRVVKA